MFSNSVTGTNMIQQTTTSIFPGNSSTTTSSFHYLQQNGSYAYVQILLVNFNFPVSVSNLSGTYSDFEETQTSTRQKCMCAKLEIFCLLLCFGNVPRSVISVENIGTVKGTMQKTKHVIAVLIKIAQNCSVKFTRAVRNLYQTTAKDTQAQQHIIFTHNTKLVHKQARHDTSNQACPRFTFTTVFYTNICKNHLSKTRPTVSSYI